MKKIVFGCSPSAGILDMWLPLLFHLRSRLPEAEFIFFDPTKKSVSQLNPADLSLMSIANEIFDTVLVRADRGNWLRYSSLFEARNSKDRTPPPESWKSRWRYRSRKLVVQLGLLKVARKVKYRVDRSITKSRKYTQAVSELIGNHGSKGILLFDLYEVDKPYMADIISIAQCWPKFSLLHGIGVRGLPGDVRTDSGINFGPDQTTALLLSSLESDFYVKQYGLKKENLSVIGIPRHSAEWVSRLQTWEASNFMPPAEGFIFVVSRPVEGAHAKKMRIEAVKEIFAVAVKHGLSVIIRLHPTEEQDGIYEEVFGPENARVNWIISNEHPLVLAKTCTFAVTFHSGVSLDVIRQGAPVIELNLMNAKRYDPMGHKLHVTSGAKPQSQYRYLNLVLGASDSKQFKDHVHSVMSNRRSVVALLKQNYSRVFPSPDDKVEETVNQIAAALEGIQR